MSKIRAILSHTATAFFGFLMALVGIGMLFGEYRDGAAHAHTTHVIIGTTIFGIGCLIIAPATVSGAASKLVMIVLDAKKGGLRWTDKMVDEGKAIPAPAKKPEIEKPPAGAGDV